LWGLEEVVQVVECLPTKSNTLNSNLSTTKKKKKKKKQADLFSSKEK
jgi:hypothetical protein